MENLSIPIYRAKKIDGDGYIEGILLPCQGLFYISEKNNSDLYLDSENSFIDGSLDGEIRFFSGAIYKIDPTTLAIHFPDMLDSEGNKIFASLREDGKGGDKFYIGDKRLNYIAMIRKNQLMAKQENTYGSFIGRGYAECKDWKAIGIKE